MHICPCCQVHGITWHTLGQKIFGSSLHLPKHFLRRWDSVGLAHPEPDQSDGTRQPPMKVGSEHAVFFAKEVKISKGFGRLCDCVFGSSVFWEKMRTSIEDYSGIESNIICSFLSACGRKTTIYFVVQTITLFGWSCAQHSSHARRVLAACSPMPLRLAYENVDWRFVKHLQIVRLCINGITF